MKTSITTLVLINLLFIPRLASASTGVDLEQQIASLSGRSVIVASIALLILISITAIAKTRSSLIFAALVLIILGTSGILIGSTIYLNKVSSSGGPVHWHADTEVWACGTEVQFKDPVGRLSNKVGTSTFHEHNDKRIHLEGVVVERHDASLGKFFRVIGGQITSSSLLMPADDGAKNYLNGQLCSNEPAQLQVFAYKTTPDMYYTVEKIQNPADYIISPSSNVPPADCIIIEFDRPKETTDKICRSYSVAEQIGRLKGRR